MAATTATTDIKAANHAMAEAFLAVCNTLNDLNLTAAVISVRDQLSDRLEVVVQFWNGPTAMWAVDLFATHLGLAHDTGQSGFQNYTREGDVSVYGHVLSVQAFCGRPVVTA